MKIEQYNTTATPQQTSNGGSASQEISQTFLTLFLASLQNQDPTEPQDTSQMISQLADIAQLEQAEVMSMQIEMLTMMVANVGSISAMSMVGKEVALAVDKFEWDAKNGDTVDGKILTDGQNMDRDYKVLVKDENGNVIKEIDAELENGELVWEWDGTNGDGDKVSSGSYEFEIAYENDEGDLIPDNDAVPVVIGRISAIQNFPTSVTSLANGMSITDAMILAIMEGTSPSEPDDGDKVPLPN